MKSPRRMQVPSYMLLEYIQKADRCTVNCRLRFTKYNSYRIKDSYGDASTSIKIWPAITKSLLQFLFRFLFLITNIQYVVCVIYFSEKYEADAERYWELFYRRHGTSFFKDRHYLEREFPELGGGEATVLEVRLRNCPQ